MFRCRISGFICLAIALHAVGEWVAAGESENRKELSEVRERIESTRKSRDELETKRKDVDKQLGQIERDYGRLTKAIKDSEAEARIQGQRLAELQRQRTSLLAAVQTQHRALAGQARAVYAAGRQEWLKLLLNQENPSRLSRVLAYYSYLNRARSALLNRMEVELAAARQLQDELSAESERLNGTRRQLVEERVALEQSKRVRRGLLAKLEHELHDKDIELNQFREDEQRLQTLLLSIGLSTEKKGAAAITQVPNPLRFAPDAPPICPLSGRLIERYGGPRMSGRWDGVVIAAEEGAPVRAVAGGRVAFSDWLRGYGLLTIIDHGEGYMSLYAFNQSLYKNVGDQVAGGDIIAAVGASGGRTEAGLYFGIREQGRPVNPMLWCNRTD